MAEARVLILYNLPVLPIDHPDAESERDVLNTVAAVFEHLRSAGFEVRRAGIGHDPGSLIHLLENERPAVVFNLFEGAADDTRTEAYVAGILEWLRIPFTGSGSQALSLARNKPLTKCLLRGAGIPTPQAIVVEKLPLAALPPRWPVIIKPADQEASVGLDQGSVVADPRALEARLAELLARYPGPLLVEEYIAGREINVAVIQAPDLQVLPFSEILFMDRGSSRWPIVTYDAKWKTGSEEDRATRPQCPADVSPHLASRLDAIGRNAFHRLGCRDYIRVDCRVNAAEQPFVLEVNTNPDFGPGAGLARELAAAGRPHGHFTLDLVRNALARGKVQL